MLPTPTTQEIATICDKGKLPGYDLLGRETTMGLGLMHEGQRGRRRQQIRVARLGLGTRMGRDELLSSEPSVG
ncbi:unnamed protein product [Linum trigynum]|uniref:Uncharacterized protein n=1 Tax=Linum trigynum TaxID=586398 RepID=A0AAV2GWP5_9ROSI